MVTNIHNICIFFLVLYTIFLNILKCSYMSHPELRKCSVQNVITNVAIKTVDCTLFFLFLFIAKTCGQSAEQSQ